MALSLNNIVNVDMVFSPKAAQTRGFGILCILGDTKNVLTAGEGYRTYTSSDDVATDFGDDARSDGVFFSVSETANFDYR